MDNNTNEKENKSSNSKKKSAWEEYFIKTVNQGILEKFHKDILRLKIIFGDNDK